MRNSAGALEIGGVDCRDLVAQYQSPVYVLDEADARSRAQGFRDAYESAGAATVYYAAKAFLATAVSMWLLVVNSRWCCGPACQGTRF